MAMLYIMSGVGFSGKSTLAKKIAEKTNAVLISQDALFFELEKKLHLDLDSDEQWEMLTGICKERIRQSLKEGRSVVFDNTNIKFEHREQLRELAQSVQATAKVIFLDTPLEIQKERQLKNKETGDRHDVKQEYLDQAIQELEVPTEKENVFVFRPDTDLELFLTNVLGGPNQ